MFLSLISLLRGETREDLPGRSWGYWWLEKVAPEDTLFVAFKVAINNIAHKKPNEVFNESNEISKEFVEWKTKLTDEWNEILKELVEWKTQLQDQGKIGERHWTQAVKFYICAKLVVDNNAKSDSASAQTLISKENEKTLADNLKNAIASSSEEFADLRKKLEASIVEMRLLVKLFVQKNDWNWVGVPVIEARGQTGRVHKLMLKKVLTSGEVMPNPTFLDNIVQDKKMEDDFLDSVINAFHFNREFWKRSTAEEQEKWKKANQDKEFGEFGFIWDLIPLKIKSNNVSQKDANSVEPEKEEGGEEEKKQGESAGLAATVGIYHALLNQFPDDRVVFSAQLETEGFEADGKTPKLTGKIKPVGGVLAKIKAAAGKTDLIDTFVIHQDNFKDGDPDTAKIKQEIDKNPPFRVKTLDDDGKEIAMYPSKKEETELSQNV